MNGILGFAELLQEGGLSADEEHEYLAIIGKSGQRMLDLINNLIDISRLEENQLKLSRSQVSPHPLLEEQVSFFAPEASRLGLELNVDAPSSLRSVKVSLDRDRITQVLTNLVGNALRFTASGSISLGYRLIGDEIEFTVRATGRGIPPESLESIFDRFRQVENSFTRNHEGAGLGLAISKALVELHGGRIWAESRVGEGSAFFFTLPFEGAEEAPVPRPRTVSPRLDLARRSQVLIVEDDEASFQFLDTILKADLDILRARSGQEAVDTMLAPNQVELVLMDIKLPDMDGLEATRRIKAEHPRIPIIAQTAFSQSEDRDNAEGAGCDAFLTKPIDRKKLYGELQRWLRGK